MSICVINNYAQQVELLREG